MAVNIYDIDYDKISKCKIEGNIVDISNYKINGIKDEYLKLSTSDNFVIVLKKYNSYNIGDNIKNIIHTENNFLLEYISNIDYWNLKKYNQNEYEQFDNIPKCTPMNNHSQSYFIFGGITIVVFTILLIYFLKKYFKTN